jgi:DNA polymerase-3 subunit gamma/tau
MSEPSRASLALARKWRPRSFATLVGQDHVVRALTHALATGRLHHAYLLTGTRGVGKTTIARILAKALNCEVGAPGQRPDPEPCGRCAACTGIDAGRYPDYVELDAASNRRVEEMTQLLDNAVYAPVAGRSKVYVIDEVHMLSTHAFNAMLKTLEEPPGHVVFVLATTDPQKVPVTVLSRCLQFSLKNVPPALVASHLASVLDAEAVPHEPEALRMIGRAANGSLRDALSIADQAIAYGAGRVGAAEVSEMLGTVDRGFVARILDALVADDTLAALAVADDMAARGLSFAQALSELALLLQRVALAQVGAAGDAGFDAARWTLRRRDRPADLQVWWQIAVHGGRDLPLAPDEHAGFTMTLLRLFAFRPDAPSGADRAAPAAGGAPAARRRRPTPCRRPRRPELAAAAGGSAEPLDGPGRIRSEAARAGPASRPGAAETAAERRKPPHRRATLPTAPSPRRLPRGPCLRSPCPPEAGPPRVRLAVGRAARGAARSPRAPGAARVAAAAGAPAAPAARGAGAAVGPAVLRPLARGSAARDGGAPTSPAGAAPVAADDPGPDRRPKRRPPRRPPRPLREGPARRRVARPDRAGRRVAGGRGVAAAVRSGARVRHAERARRAGRRRVPAPRAGARAGRAGHDREGARGAGRALRPRRPPDGRRRAHHARRDRRGGGFDAQCRTLAAGAAGDRVRSLRAHLARRLRRPHRAGLGATALIALDPRPGRRPACARTAGPGARAARRRR